MSMQTADSPRFSAWSRMIKTLTSPSTAFAELAEHPKPPFLLAYIVAALMGIPLIYASTQIAMPMVQEQLATLPPGAQSVGQAVGVGTVIVTGLIGPFVGGLCVTLLAMLVGLFIGGGVRFRQYLSMVAYASLPSAIGGLIQGLLAFGASSVTDLQRISISAAALLPSGSSTLVLALGGMINPFTIWSLYLAMVGFATLHRSKLSKGAIFAGTLFVFQLLLVVWSGTRTLPQ